MGEFDGLTDLHVTTTVGDGKEVSPALSGEVVLHCFGFSPGRVHDDIGALALVLALALAAVFVLLRCVVRERR